MNGGQQYLRIGPLIFYGIQLEICVYRPLVGVTY